MAMNVGGGHETGTLSDINVTPLVDVMLVLLIVFMVTAPMLQTGVDVDLPDAKAQTIPDDSGNPIPTAVYTPEELYEDPKGVPPDLIVVFGDLLWRSVGTIGGDEDGTGVGVAFVECVEQVEPRGLIHVREPRCLEEACCRG